MVTALSLSLMRNADKAFKHWPISLYLSVIKMFAVEMK